MYAKQERILAGFEDVARFRETSGHAPRHGPHLDICERLYAVRFERLGKLPEEDLALLRPPDRFGLLAEPEAGKPTDALSDDELLAVLAEDMPGNVDTLVHVQSFEVKRDKTDYIADRVKCVDFGLYKPLFDAAQADLAMRRRTTKPFMKVRPVANGESVSCRLVALCFPLPCSPAPLFMLNRKMRRARDPVPKTSHLIAYQPARPELPCLAGCSLRQDQGHRLRRSALHRSRKHQGDQP